MAEKTIERGKIRRPVGATTGTKVGKPIDYGIRTPGSDFDRRPDSGPAPAYVGPSKVEDRGSSIKGGKGQSKKHISSGKGQS